jgi:hypothetical protein
MMFTCFRSQQWEVTATKRSVEIMTLDDVAGPIRQSTLVKVKNRAFDANRRAKLSDHSRRDSVYREKDSAINYLLEAECAFVDSVDWSVPDPILGVTFVGGGRLHMKLSCLTSHALHSVRRQLEGRLTPDRGMVTRCCQDFRARTAA